MKTDRNNHKTMRISDKLLQFIEDFPGDSFNDKVNNLLEFYCCRDAEYSDNLRRLEEQIQDKQKLLDNFSREISRYRDLFK